MKRIFVVLIGIALFTGMVKAQTHFQFTSNTGNSALISVPVSINPNINGKPLQNGDEIGAFTPAGLCVGAVVWDGVNNKALVAWGNDQMTDEIDGLQSGEEIHYRIWRQSTNTEYEFVEKEYSEGNGIYEPNGIYVLSLLSAISPPSPPVLSSPSNNSTGVSVNPTLSWSASSGADSYTVQVSKNSNMSSPVVNQSGIAGTSFQVNGLENNTQYYWRVRAVNEAGAGDWSSVWNFTTIVAPPSAPTLLSPPNNETGVSVNPILSWNASSGAETYTLQVSKNSNMSSPVVNQSGITGTSYQVTGLENGTQYYWRVRAVNAGGTSNWSSTWNFTTIVSPPSTPVLSSPSNGATGVSLPPTLSWNTSTGAESYTVQISKNSNMSSPVVNQSGITGTSFQVTGLENDTQYYWRVRAVNAGGTSDWSATWNFTTIVAPPSAPVLSSPSNNATGVSVNPTLSWNASGGAETYTLQVSKNSNMSSPVVNQSGITGTSYQVNGLENGTQYYWRVRAVNAGGESEWSETWNFTTTVSPPSTPVLSSPENNATGVPVNPTLTWNSASGADTYTLQVSKNSNMSSPVVNQSGITGTSFQVSGLENGTQYFWRVRAVNTAGESGWSTVWNFTTVVVAPPVPVLVSPSNEATGISVNPTLNWEESDGAESYTVQVSKRANMSQPVVNQSDVTGISYGLTNLDYNTRYYWRVRAVNSAGESSWSDTWNFTTQVELMTMNIALNSGWNIISTYLEPANSSIVSLFESVQDKVVLVKNSEGKVYWPELEIDEINDWDCKEGYQVFMSEADGLVVEGYPVISSESPIDLQQGWNITAYHLTAETSPSTAFENISENLVIVKDNHGRVYWPAYDINTLSNMIPGQGYYIFVSENVQLVYPQ